MTNNWADIGNATMVVAWGCNPVENHPACAAHINRARFPKDYFADTDLRYNKPGAKLIVVDPRKTRTALLVDESRGDRYVRIRPGTDIALLNGVIKYIIDEMESGAYGAWDASGTVAGKFYAYLNKKNAGTFYADQNSATAKTVGANGTAGGSSVYTDARFIVNGAGTDYERAQIDWATGHIKETAITPDATTISNFPLKAATVFADDNTVYNKLKAHVAAYDAATVADICDCSEADVEFIGDAYIAHSRCSSDIGTGHPLYPTKEDPRNPGYEATTMLYAMGITQHTYGAQNVKGFAVLQVLMGNMGRAGGGINALRGIHNVQGSTDMGLLYGNIPAYSGNPTLAQQPSSDANGFGKYMDKLWGNPLSGTGKRTTMDGSYDDAYDMTAGNLQQQGFYNMTCQWFGDQTIKANRTKTDAAFSLWPKGNGHNHVKMFREMAAGRTKAAVVWGQNPAVTEPNQGAVRAGLYAVDLLVVTDMFETESAACDRKTGGKTYLLPACSHVEKAGSATNSGRTLQWRYQAIPPRGDSKDDTELLLRLAYKLDEAGAFSHIKSVWTTAGISCPTTVYDKLYKDLYGGFNGTSGFDALAGVTGDYATSLGTLTDTAATYNTAYALTGSELVAEKIYREMATNAGTTGTIWIYTRGYDATGTGQLDAIAGGYTGWSVMNRAKSRDRQDPFGTFGFHKWGYSWLVNRRVLYNNTEIPGDQADYFMTADSQARLFVSSAPPALANYSRWYRTYHTLSDTPRKADNSVPAIHVLPGKFPAHTEPYETPREDLIAIWGKNASTGTDKGTELASKYMNLLTPGTDYGTVATYPYVMTSIRCVEHFQGGPITRNNMWNVEAEPVPWIELNSADAMAEGIADGDMVKIVTARNEGFASDEIESTYPRALYGEGFIARVGTGLPTNQRVARGVVAIPWHWGDRGLSTGSRANDLCIDAGDANTYIPEYKACLCRLEKM